MREGDIEALRNKMKLAGKPIKSNTIIKGNRRIHYKTDKNGRVRIVGEDRT